MEAHSMPQFRSQKFIHSLMLGEGVTSRSLSHVNVRVLNSGTLCRAKVFTLDELYNIGKPFAVDLRLQTDENIWLVLQSVDSGSIFTVLRKLASFDDLKLIIDVKERDRKILRRIVVQQSILYTYKLKTLFSCNNCKMMRVTQRMGFNTKQRNVHYCVTGLQP